MMVYEVGKNWAEADGDTAEAIDFMEFYAREMLRYSEGQDIIRIPGEKNKVEYIPLGVGVVVPPWNFPLAILVGMTAAAIVTGNTVVLKPSSDSPAIARMFFELLEEVKLPKGVVNFVTGDGSVIGDLLSNTSADTDSFLLRDQWKSVLESMSLRQRSSRRRYG